MRVSHIVKIGVKTILARRASPQPLLCQLRLFLGYNVPPTQASVELDDQMGLLDKDKFMSMTRWNKAAILAWGLCVVITIVSAFDVGQVLLNRQAQGDASQLVTRVFFDFIPIAFGIVGALILSRQPRNVLGWLLMTPALSLVLGDAANSYVQTISAPPPQPSSFLLFSLWFSATSWVLFIFPLFFIALLFPTGSPTSKRWRWVVAYAVGLICFFYVVSLFSDTLTPQNRTNGTPWTIRNPIGFIPAAVIGEIFSIGWGIALAALAILCLISLIVRYRRGGPVERAQLKWVLYACGIFAVVYVPLLGAEGNAQGILGAVLNVLFGLGVLGFPLAIGIAILRYRLFDIEIIIHRTLVYVPLTAIMAGVFAASITITQKVFVSLAGQSSEAAGVLTTLVVVAAFDPVKTWLQKIVDKHFKETVDGAKRLRAFNERVRNVLQVIDPAQVARTALDEAVASLSATGGEVYLTLKSRAPLAYATDKWQGNAKLAVPLCLNGAPMGRLELGGRKDGAEYAPEERAILEQTAALIGRALELVESPGP